MHLAEALQIAPGDDVALVGAGGKTTALFRLARELTDAGRRILLTTTTHLALEQTALAARRIGRGVHGVWPEVGAADIESALRAHGCALITGPADRALGKWTGLSAADLAPLRRLADLLLVEADGARQLPLKAPADHEPAIPDCATLVVVVVGLDVLGQPLTAAHVHRPERMSALTGAILGDPVTPELIARLLLHPMGGRKHVPPGARLIALLNKAETVERLAAARQLAALLLAENGYHQVLVGSLVTAQTDWAVFPSAQRG